MLGGNIDSIKAIGEVLVRRVLLEKLGAQSIEDFLQILEIEAQKNSKFGEQYPYVKKLVTGEMFDVEEELKQKVEKSVEHLFNSNINCGGYALKIDTCIFPCICEFEKSVSSILETFQFVRLLGDTQLGDDEYLVLYRSSEKGGHHFVRIEEDGTVVEKNDCQSPQKFQNWGILSTCPEAVFAVKKEHEMSYFKENGHILLPTDTSMNFEETVWQAIQKRENTFEYHNHIYVLKKAGEDVVYICSNGEVIAEMMTDGKEYDIEVRNGKKAYVSNTQPSIPIIIKDGKYQKVSKDEILL